MKKTLLLAIVGLASASVCHGQPGYISLENYAQAPTGPLITFGLGSSGPLGTGITSDFTVGLYYGQGAFAASVANDPYGWEIPTSLHPLLLLGTGAGSTTQADPFSGGLYSPGRFASFSAFQANSTAGSTITVMLVAYDGPSYAQSFIRGHSDAFEMPTLDATGPQYPMVGDYMNSFSVVSILIPEPSTLALAGLGLASMLFARHRK